MEDVTRSHSQHLDPALAETERVIKKAPNRRLYDYRRCAYVKLTDLAPILRETPDVLVIERLSSRDITRRVFWQSIGELELEAATPVMTSGLLKQLLLLRDTVPRRLLTTFLDQAIRHFVETLKDSEHPLAHGADPAELAEDFLERWNACEGVVPAFFKHLNTQSQGDAPQDQDTLQAATALRHEHPTTAPAKV
jgi:polyhydroxyalkanoate synthesis repressor PhaR